MSTLIQLREQDATIINNNGDFTINLDQPVELFPGDSITVKSAFIDTKADNDTMITLDEDITLTATYGYTFTYQNDETKPFITGTPAITGKKYFACKYKVGSTHPSNCTAYTKVYCSGDGHHKWGGFNLDYRYDDVNGVQRGGRTYINVHETRNTYENCNFIAKTGSITIITKTAYMRGKGTSKISPDDFNGTAVPDVNTFHDPILYSSNVTIPAGKYDTTEIGQYITQQFTQIIDTNVNLPNPANNNLLTTLKHIKDELTAAGNNEQISFLPINDTTSFLQANLAILTDDVNMYLGTNQYAILYDTTIGKFKVDQIHKPIFSMTQGDIVVKTVKHGSDVYLNNSSMGIYHTALEPEEFWQGTLGFDFSNEIISSLTPKDRTIGGSNITLLEPNLVDGITTTGNYLGLDSIIIKTNSDKTKDISDLVAPFDTGFVSTSTTNVPILASNPYVNQLTSGYFLVEISGIANSTKTIGENYVNSDIRAVVSRYYSVNSYTSAGSESDIPYINISNNSVYINALNVRILSPDGELASDYIQGDNTIFLQINRRNLLNPSIPPPKEDKK